MDKNIIKLNKKLRRRGRIRFKISGTKLRPRLSVFRSNASMFLQLIDDENSVTLIGLNQKNFKKTGTKTEVSFEMGKVVAEEAKKMKIEEIVFDRGGNKYHGRVKAVADGAREGGLKF